MLRFNLFSIGLLMIFRLNKVQEETKGVSLSQMFMRIAKPRITYSSKYICFYISYKKFELKLSESNSYVQSSTYSLTNSKLLLANFLDWNPLQSLIVGFKHLQSSKTRNFSKNSSSLPQNIIAYLMRSHRSLSNLTSTI